ncbi:uroporphyrin-III C-methyltransferase [Hygrophoropsis aurantiaca]|uniref:Uroporphyrin-III C-methyltransferase n=1 Tax=Hygrophoropsis aurantiaca TaxID=72124 RepID=A0ACB8AFH2_9AGAM|nr:uroporphyrin-III C-methyltransferase [Hygrophoropsis aurantiaca]
MDSLTYPTPVGGASLMLSFRLQNKTTLIIGSSALAASRAFAALEADSQVIILVKGGQSSLCNELLWRARQNQITVINWDTLPTTSSKAEVDADVDSLDAYLTRTPGITLVCVTDTVSGTHRRTRASAAGIYRTCRRHNIPVNVTDMPEYCDFSFMASQRFVDHTSGTRTPLQVGVTTNGQGCRLASRIKREIVAALPRDVGDAVVKVRKFRGMAKASAIIPTDELEEVEEENEDNGVTTPNRPVPSRNSSETAIESAKRRMRWVAQVGEYWPITRLAQMTETEMDDILNGSEKSSIADGSLDRSDSQNNASTSVHDLALLPPTRKGQILLVGSGPGHPSLLTIATHTALTKRADLVLSDKLVPAAVLDIIPPNVEVRIARKFPGNADYGQAEMMEAAVEAAKRGLTVVRLKQGDPVVYGRASEEVIFFREHGFPPIVIPGVSSALAAPTFAGIPVTQRGVAESFVVCTGVGRKGKAVRLPGYERGRTLLVLMGVARLAQVVSVLLGPPPPDSENGHKDGDGGRDGPAYPPCTPIAIIERGSMPDQRVIASTLRDIVGALESVGEQRPPGMMVIGWGVLGLSGKGEDKVLEVGAEAEDETRIKRWLSDERWIVSEGIEAGWETL